jgi:hypothetical protein
MESALLIFACLARYVMPILTQYMATLNGVLQVGVLFCGCFAAPVLSCAQLRWAVVWDGCWARVACHGFGFIRCCTHLAGQRTTARALDAHKHISNAPTTLQPPPVPSCHCPPPMLQQCLGHADSDVRLAAMKATCVFISELESAEDRDKFQATLPALLSCIARALNEGDEGAAQVGG